MSPAVSTCPKCGALTAATLARCRQCNQYLKGTALEGWLVDHLLPKRFATAPVTGALVGLTVLYYAVMVVAAGPMSALGMSSYSLRRLGATHGPPIFLGEYWRLATSVWAHHDIIHVAFNLSALGAVGPWVEQLYARRETLLIYLIGGIGSMGIGHLYYTEIRDSLSYVSAGGSGAISALIGATLIGAKKLGPQGEAVKNAMTRWVVITALLGFVLPVNNAAHGGGFVLGAAFAAVFPLGGVKNHTLRLGLSATVLLAIAIHLVAVGQMLSQLGKFPNHLEHDEEPGRVFMFTYRSGADREFSSQQLVWQDCRNPAPESKSLDQAIASCELSAAVNSSDPTTYRMLAYLYDHSQQHEKAQKFKALSDRLVAERR
jgi:membrane associated rhomboid family serine protease